MSGWWLVPEDHWLPGQGDALWCTRVGPSDYPGLSGDGVGAIDCWAPSQSITACHQELRFYGADLVDQMVLIDVDLCGGGSTEAYGSQPLGNWTYVSSDGEKDHFRVAGVDWYVRPGEGDRVRVEAGDHAFELVKFD